MRRESRLAHETSPYLLQHARNPVDWYPWGSEALERAQREDKPILLSIGYSACHWCHVMEHESFENDDIAALMNEHFVCIKVDREERPDLDEIYMNATVALSGSGGWPMTVFLTPKQEPFFAGTYFPPEDRQGRPGFPRLLDRIADLWKNSREELLEQARELSDHVRSAARLPPALGVSVESIRLAVRQLEREFEPSFGGFGNAPKFPPSAALALLLRHHRHTGETRALEMVERTLDGMGAGGMYDQLGGGFARYSVDEKWLVPHFEKMLYDNAQLSEIYLEGYQVFGHDAYRRIARETFDYVLREMQSPEGGFFSSSDADSEGEEGTYFVFTLAEVKKALGEPDAARFAAFYGVTESGNFEGKNVLSAYRSLEAVARDLKIEPFELADSLARGREKLLERRSRRVAPAVDDKILTAWNGLMIRSLARGAVVLGEPRYLNAAARAADFLLRELRDADGRLLRTSRAGRAHLAGYLEDYAFLADGLLGLYEAGGGARFFDAARELCARMIADFADADAEPGALYHTAHHHEALLARPREGHDGALPNANAVAARVLGRLAAHTGDEALRLQALAIVRAFGSAVQRAPRAFCTLLGVVDFLLEPPLEIVLAGDADDENYQELERVLGALYLPQRVEARTQGDGDDTTPLVAGKAAVRGEATAYVCQGFTCRAPVTSPEEFQELLGHIESDNRAARSRELGRRALTGRATAAGTARVRGRAGLSADAFRDFHGLQLSRVAQGTYRLGLDHPEHRRALRHALESGLNFIDTSPTFARGDGERLIGEVLSELVREEKVARDEIVVVSKIGLVVGPAAESLAEREGSLVHTVPLQKGESLERGAFSLDPSVLREQLDGSLERLGLDHLDVCTVQSPEHLLLAGLDRDTYESALEETFRFLEEEVRAGRVGAYGILTNTSSADASLRVELPRLVEIAEKVAGKGHHFRLVELPVNVAEDGALLGRDGRDSVVHEARELGLFVLAVRPLSVLSEGALLRLVDPPRVDDGARVEDLSATRYRVASLEAEFETTLAPALRVTRQLGPEPLLPMSRGLGAALERAHTLPQFEQGETTLVTPRLRAILSELDRVHVGPETARWQEFRDRYVQAVGAYLACIRESIREKNLALLSALEDKLNAGSHVTLPASAPWAERAPAWLLGQPDIDAVAWGLRERTHVEAARRVLEALAPAP